MPFHERDGIRYYTFRSLEHHGIVHAALTRRGGISPQPWAALNLGGTVGDDPRRVADNRYHALQALGLREETIYDVWQVHGTDAVIAECPRPANVPHRKADIILCDRPQVTLLMRFADCVPILLYDAIHRVVGIAHAGWQGTVKRVAFRAVQAMQSAFRSHPEDILAAIGPSIAAHHYQVGREVVEQVQVAFGSNATALLPASNGGVQFDLWAANSLLLEQAGVRQIELAGICTACHLEDWFSHRGEGGRTGRFGVLIGLE